MDRFTTKENAKPELISCVYCLEHSNCYSNMSCPEIYNALSKLRYYENLEEQGKLAVLPCKIGDTVYQPSYKFTKCSACDYEPRYAHDSECECCEAECDSVCNPYIHVGKVVEMRINELSKGEVTVRVRFTEKFDSSYYTIGESIFLSKEEAEVVLRGK